MSIPTADEFVNMFKNPKQEKVIKFARIDPDYVSGRPRLIFDGEESVSGKQYPYLGSYAPAAHDRVMLVKGVIIGAII
jgi:hypothetical protein